MPIPGYIVLDERSLGRVLVDNLRKGPAVQHCNLHMCPRQNSIRRSVAEAKQLRLPEASSVAKALEQVPFMMHLQRPAQNLPKRFVLCPLSHYDLSRGEAFDYHSCSRLFHEARAAFRKDGQTLQVANTVWGRKAASGKLSLTPSFEGIWAGMPLGDHRDEL